MKRLLLSLLLFCLAFFYSVAAPVTASVKEEYVKTYAAVAVAEMQRTGVPASITLAQGLLESAAGQSSLAKQANNHFGIKCHSDWTGEGYYQDDDKANECFRAYASAQESYVAHSDFLKGRSRYASLFELETGDYKGWAKGLSAAGYATDPKYAGKLIGIIDEFELYKYDRMETVPVEVAKAAAASAQDIAVRLNEAETVLFSLGRPVYYIDGAKCLYSQPGESYESIAKDCHLFNSEIRRFNSVPKKAVLEPYTYVFVQKPAKKK